MAKDKEIKFVNYIIINGEKIPMNSLSDEERKIIGTKLNDTAMRAIGYVPVEETD